jgi:hypothetical protein
MIILAIDPGQEKSGVVLYDSYSKSVLSSIITKNEAIIDSIIGINPLSDLMVYEMIGHYGSGMPAGKSVFETCIWIGRFIEACRQRQLLSYRLLRATIKSHICGSVRANDSNIRQALIDRFSPSGGGKTPQIGTKKQPGPLYGVKSHIWSALAVAIAYAEGARSE